MWLWFVYKITVFPVSLINCVSYVNKTQFNSLINLKINYFSSHFQSWTARNKMSSTCPDPALCWLASLSKSSCGAKLCPDGTAPSFSNKLAENPAAYWRYTCSVIRWLLRIVSHSVKLWTYVILRRNRGQHSEMKYKPNIFFIKGGNNCWLYPYSCPVMKWYHLSQCFLCVNYLKHMITAIW